MLHSRMHLAKHWFALCAGVIATLTLFSFAAGGASAQTAPSPTTPNRTITITPADNGQTYHIGVGDRVVVKMGDSLDWTVDVEPPGILIPVPGVGTLARGVQAIYLAAQPGTAQLTATGRPICDNTGPCPLFIVLVRVTIIVGPSVASG